jgi:peptidyl-prolyl cis-trans isomerase SurA
MKKNKFIIVALLVLLAQTTSAQVLFTFGKHPVTVDEFRQSFEKNNPDSTNSKTAFQNYLDLYIKFKLKVKAAYDLRMDTLHNQIADRLAFEEQIMPLHFLDSATLDALVKEAIAHSLQEVDLSHIFIAFKQPYSENSIEPETVSVEEKDLAYRKIKEIKQRLQLGESFETVAVDLSNDTEAKQNKGHLGFIKAFTLPYRFEKIAYSLNDSEVSDAIESKMGLHLFKREGSRKAEGKMVLAQILITIPELATTNEINNRAMLADSIYQKAMHGADFDSLATLYSEDRSSNTSGGWIENLETGDYDPLFEYNMKSLKRDGEISPVFKTAYGFHILKRIKQDSLKNNPAQWKADVREMVLQDARTEVAKEVFIQKSIGKNGLTQAEKNKEEYISKRMKDFSPAFASQTKDFKDGNLLFEIMDKKIWSKASIDLEALKVFHAERKQNYQWKNSVTAITITAQSKDIASAIRTTLQENKSIENLRKQYAEIAFIDSARYEASALLGVGASNAKEGFISEVYNNESDGSSSFVYVLKVHKDPSTMDFTDARVSVINDYQNVLEEKWIAELKKKYPVSINQSLLIKLLKERN